MIVFALLSLVLATSAGADFPSGDPLADQVTIYRDEFGVPHIAGESEKAAFFGYGYAQAEDHLERMMIQYRDAQGRRAEILGPEALGGGWLKFIPYEYRWDGDYLQRLLRTKKGVLERKGEIDPGVYRVLDGFARGVNAYIAEHRAEVPAWIDSITAEDIEALERSQYFRFYSVHDALSKMPEGTYPFPNLGSNQWAIARGKSANGRIIHVEHTHMPWANRFQNYEAHLIVPGKLDAGGISWFGSPFFLDGFNDRITWSATWNEPNMADIYEEKIDPRNPLKYLHDGAWRDIRVERETFQVKGGEPVTLPLYFTHHGPIVKFDREKNRAWSVKLPNFEGVGYSEGLYGLMKARGLDEIKAHLARQLLPRWNFLYTDSHNIYWVHNGSVARRAEGFDWTRPVPGWLKETEWGPFLPFESYPQLLNPPSGFLQNCNNPPWVATRNSGLRPLDPAPYYLKQRPGASAGEEALNTRGERLFQVLGQDRKFTLAEMIDLGFDTYILPAEVIVPLLSRAQEKLAGKFGDPRIARAMERIRSWDLRSGKDSIAYTYIHFWGKSYRDLFSGKFGRFLSYHRKREIDLDSSEEQEMALRALEEALRRIEKRFGKLEVPWGEINVVVRGGTFPLDGEDLYGVLHPDEGREQDDGRIHCDDGWGHLLVVMEGEPKEIWSLLPYGQSEDPSSPHYNDQTKLHSRRQAKRFWFTPEEILAHAESVRGDPDRLKKLIAATSEEPRIREVPVRLFFNRRLGPLEIGRFALGQGGLSEEPMWADRAAEIRALRPRMIRLFLQEYFDFLPDKGRYHFETFDRSLDLILSTGARPLLSIDFKPRVLFPAIDQDAVEPNDPEEWERLILALVRHARERGAGGAYWEVSNEPDIGEDGGCPYRFKPEGYNSYYRRTASAILRADPDARVGGPALANPGSPILPALLDFCEKEKVPLHFVSWHIYTDDPLRIRATIDSVKSLLAKHPSLRPETVLDEWNMSLGNPPRDPRFQPCFVAEVAFQMKEAGLDWSCYYHIRDWHISPETFARFMSKGGTAFMEKWWNRMPQFDGLFDFQNTARPAYFLFKLLSRLSGERLRLESGAPPVHGLMTLDDRLGLYNLLLWNFGKEPVRIRLVLEEPPGKLSARPLVLDALAASSNENSRLRPLDPVELGPDKNGEPITLEPYGVRFWSMERR